MMDRRTFLAAGAALPWVFGWREEATAQEGDPAWLAMALARMKETGRWGLVIVAPDREEDRVVLGRRLYDLAEFEDEGPETHELLCQVVVMAVTSDRAAARFPVPGARPSRILLSPEGKILASDAVAAEVYKTPAEFLRSFGPFIHGADQERLRACAEGLRVEVREAGERIGSEDREARIDAVVALSREAERITPYLGFLARLGPNAEARKQASLLLRRYYAALKAETPGERLPYGCTLGKFANQCGHYVPEGKVTIGCGMARVNNVKGKFVTFLAR